MTKKSGSHIRRRLVLLSLGATLAGFAAAYDFALKYRQKVGQPHRSPVEGSPADFGLKFEDVRISAGDRLLAGWYVPADGSSKAGKAGKSGPGVVVVHGWESNRGRTFAHVRYLHAAGFHCLVFDVRGHGDSPDDDLPINVPEFAEDTVAAVRWLAARPEVSAVGVIGHSMGAAGAIVAAAEDPDIKAVVSMSAPADLVLMTRKTFDMAELHVPRPVATPLAYLSAAVLLAPRRRKLDDASAAAAAARYRGPLLLIHGAQDHGVPVEHLEIIARSAADHRRRPEDPDVETLVLPEFGHRWLYEDEGCRRAIASFFARTLGGVEPSEAADRAAACVVVRPEEPTYGFGAMAGTTPPNSSSALS